MFVRRRQLIRSLHLFCIKKIKSFKAASSNGPWVEDPDSSETQDARGADRVFREERVAGHHCQTLAYQSAACGNSISIDFGGKIQRQLVTQQ